MFASSLFAIAAALALSTSVVAEPTPLEPDSTSIFQEGGNCTISWDKDATGTWTTMYIELMTGDNFNQVHLKTVATLDATTETSFAYTCLGVTPHAQIYFYKFTSPSSTDSLFTTRFTITGPDGSTVAPTATETATNGDLVAWGTGALTDPSQGDQPPVLGNNTNSANQSSSTAAPTNGGASSQSSDAVRTGTSSAESHASSSTTGAGVKNLPVVGSFVAGLVGAASVLFL